MHFGIVVSDPEDWTAIAIMAAFQAQGAQATFLNLSDLSAQIGDGLLSSFVCAGVNLADLDGIVVRDLGRSRGPGVAFRFETISILEDMGIYILNPPQAIARAANKYATSVALQRSKVPTPRTAVTSSFEEAQKILGKYGRAVSKPLFGYKGRGIQLLTQADSQAKSGAVDMVLKEILESQGMIYLQEFVESSRPRDIRAFVVGEEVLGAIYRVAPAGAWISNLAAGGKSKPCQVTDNLANLAIRASRAVGTGYCGVDLMETPDGLKVIEVNGTPSGKGIFEALGVNVADSIAELALSKRPI